MDGGFVYIDLLSGGPTVDAEDIKNFHGILPVCFEKQQAIIYKKQVADLQSGRHHSDSFEAR
jgi:hypothetical protein